ncbi:hypothetical protein HMI01_04360 [Halolactibacillus miurensis]|uniref:Flagellar biosynthesis protein n=1 Tax=Halolactibacillus miurensis TaxID=306541 RepID=A0A1I6QD69_9BACI|nr:MULTISPECIES: EscU/YscU/HrcU family type III secretion system export apparatus switch protein [Halolactibacillus]GEM03448.1 hypothetical protein HMI01_04360 [Halolactibacillus miurensis]SFS50416.1 flagellar biosynthesis protein [Halolactibacillus miurensis]
MTEEKERPHHLKKAMALRYNETKDLAPVVSAKGQGYVAEEIIKRAHEAGVPIQEDQSLVEMLGQIDINQAIPEELYLVVAEVFAFIYHVDRSNETN